MNVELRRLADLGWVGPEAAADGVRYSAQPDVSAISYQEDGFAVLGLEGGSGYWFDHRAAGVIRLLNSLHVSSMWEVGAGTGAMALRIRPALSEIITVEPLVGGAQASAALGLTSFCSTLQDLRLPERSLESIGVFDVLEHLEHPEILVEEMHRVLQPGGVMVATVPAFQGLWGSEDDVAGHFRRYTKATLELLLARGGFSTVRSEYLYASLVPPAAIFRALPYRLGRRASREAVLETLRDQLKTRPTVDRVARAVLAAESAVSKHVPLPFGLSVLAACKNT